MFNRHMMALARSSRGETQTSLANALKVTQGTISKYENGTNEPSSDFVEDLAGFLKYRPEFFYEPGRPHGMPPFHYRKRKKLGVKPLEKIVAEINIRRLHVQRLLKSFEDIPKNRIPEVDEDEYIGKSRAPFSIETVAIQLREFWGLGNGPVPNVVELIESNGGLVIPCNFGTDLIDAVSQRLDGLPVLFFINANAPMDRMRHTLVHELGHMVLHTTSIISDEKMEDQADEFAGAFLLPKNEFSPQIRNKFGLRKVAQMKPIWKVSMQAIAYRAKHLDLITPHQYKMFFIEMGKLGYRKREPYEPPRERPTLLRRMLEFHRVKLGYTDGELASLLMITVGELQELYSRHFFEGEDSKSTGSHLRVVR